MKISFEAEHEIGDIVYLKTDDDQYKWQVMSYVVRPSEIFYELINFAHKTYYAYPFEISTTKEL